MPGTVETRSRAATADTIAGVAAWPKNAAQPPAPIALARSVSTLDLRVTVSAEEDPIGEDARGEGVALDGAGWHPTSTLSERLSLAPVAGGHPARQVAEAITRTAAPRNETELVLTPEELGTVRFTVTQQDGVVTIAISADRPDTLALLRRNADMHEAVLDAVLHHHEKIDGSGYPDKLAGAQISLIAKMAAICDVYDAITSNRPYKNGWDPSESLRRMAEWTRDHFDAKLFQAFVKSIGIYPVGSLVRLASGRIGVVTQQSGKSLLMPCVKVFFSTKSDLRIPPEVIDLSAPGCSEKIVGREDPAQWNFPDLNELWSGQSGQPW